MSGYQEFKNDLRGIAIYFIGIMLITSTAKVVFGFGLDNSDYSSMQRSGLTIHTDALTGVQYLSNGKSLVVRIDSVGNPIIKE